MMPSLIAALAALAQGAPEPDPRQPQEPVPVPEAAPEAAPSDARPPTDPKRQSTLDSVQLIVNEDCITIVDLQQMAAQKGKQASTREDSRRLLQESVEQLTRNRLMQQAGRDLGYQKEMIDAFVREELNQTRERYGSVAALAEDLERSDFSSVRLKQDTEDYIYREFWKGAVIGKHQGPGGRPYVDRYVRPGLLLLEFKHQGSRLDLPTKVQLEEMIIAPELGEPPDSARQKAQIVRTRLANGEDFYELNAQFGLPGRDPEIAPIEESKLALMPEAKAFVEGAQPGDVSEIIPIVRGGQLAGFRILRFVGRQQGRAASFVDREFQEQVRKSIEERRDTANQERGLRELLDAAYVWPPELSTRARRQIDPPAPAPQETPEQPAPQPAEPPPTDG